MSVAQTKQPKALADALVRVAGLEFATPVVDPAEVQTWIAQQQHEARQKSFPPLVQLRPRQHPNQGLPTTLAGFKLRKANIEARSKEYDSARSLTNTVRKNAIVIADALDNMIQTGLIDREQAVQLCPLCAHESPATLTQQRLLDIGGWKPLVEAEKCARYTFKSEINDMKHDLQTPIQEASDTLPDPPRLDQYLQEAPNDLLGAVSTLATIRSPIDTDVRQHLDKAQLLVKVEMGHLDTLTKVEIYASEYTVCIDNLKGLPERAEEYRQALKSVEAIVGQAASSDEEYRKRQSWLSCDKAQADVLNDFKWERAKSAAQKDLRNIRKELIKFRGEYLEGRRALFSQGMQDVWSCLRADTYSVFSNL